TSRLDQARGTTRAGSRSRQQRRPGPQGAEEEDAARGYFPRDEAPRSLRKALRKESPRKGGSDPPGAQARAQADAARGSPADEAEAYHRPWRRSRARSAPTKLLIDSSPRFAIALQRGPCGPRRFFLRYLPRVAAVVFRRQT